MQLTQAAMRMETAVEAQLRVGDSDLATLGAELLELLRPAFRQTLMEVVEMAAQEVNGQLVGQRVDIRLVDGDPELSIRPDDSRFPPPPQPPSPGDVVDPEARITLRLPTYLKDLIAEAAEGAGGSINAFVVDALRSKAYERASSSTVRRTIDL